MKTPEELRAKAAKCRRLAVATSDRTTAEQLTSFALELEALADVIAGLSSGRLFAGDQAGQLD